jgi:hypothetical protein
MRLVAAFCSVVVVVGAAAPAQAAKGKKAVDTAAPTITHTPPLACPKPVPPATDVPCAVEAVIVDDSGVFDPTLLFRLQGSAAYDRAPMKPREGAADTYVGVVPAAVAAAGDVEYLIEAFDVEGNGPARAGTEAAPLVLAKAAPVVVVVPPPPPVEEDNTGLVVGVVAVSAVVVVAAAVGVGVAVYALRPPAIDAVTVSVEAPTPFAAVAP